MITRLKQSIMTAKEWATFLKKRATLEEEHAQGLKQICRGTQNKLHAPDYRADSFSRALDETMAIHERMADNEMQFAMSLHQMHDDLQELAAVAEKSRKGWKASGLAAEQRVVELQTAVRKSKAKYDSLADEFERAKTGDSSGQKGRFGFKVPKSAAQHEDDLQRKVNGADADYHGKVQTLQQERGDLLNRTRPETIKALQDLVRECDSSLVMQMQKFGEHPPCAFLFMIHADRVLPSHIQREAAPEQRHQHQPAQQGREEGQKSSRRRRGH
jgi:Rho GTPase-activating protein RGD1